jgi:uncharacterized protein (TIGR02246 family)
MPARKPKDCDIHLMEALNRGDLEAAASLYEPNATFVQEPSGPVISGRAPIRETIRDYLELKLQMTRETRAPLSNDGELALTGGKWKATGTDPNGNPIVMSGHSTELVRHQPDGTWCFVIDNPWWAGVE